MTRISIIGGGTMGAAFIAGMFKVSYPSKDMVLCEKESSISGEIVKKYPIKVTESTEDAIEGANVIVLAVNAPEISSVVNSIKNSWNLLADEPLIVTFSPTSPAAYYESGLPAGAYVIRAVPDLSMSVANAVTILSAGRFVKEDQINEIDDIFSKLGEVIFVKENKLAAASALSGSSLAFTFLLTEALTDTGISMGLSLNEAQNLARYSIEGAGKLLTDMKLTPADLRHQVAFPGSANATAVDMLERKAFRGMVNEAIYSAKDKINLSYEEETKTS